MKTTLLTAIGSYAAMPAIQSLHAMGHRVIGCDIYPQAWNAAAFEVDGFFRSVLATDAEAYTAQLEEVVKRERIDYLIPLTDVEVDVLCAQKGRFAALGCTVCVPDEPAAKLCRNKMEMAAMLDAAGVCQTIPTADPYGREPLDSEFPIMLKPRSGRSSQGQAVVRDLDEYRAALKQRGDYIAQPYLEGSVYTVDVSRDLYGSARCLVREELLRTVNGLGTTVKVLPGHPLESVCADIAQAAGIIGTVNMEFIEHGQSFYFLEVNPRFSGGVGFSQTAGMDFVKMHILCHEGDFLPKAPQVAPMTLTRRMETVITEK